MNRRDLQERQAKALTEPAEVDSGGEQDWESDEHESAASEQDTQASQEKATMY